MFLRGRVLTLALYDDTGKRVSLVYVVLKTSIVHDCRAKQKPASTGTGFLLAVGLKELFGMAPCVLVYVWINDDLNEAPYALL